MLASFLTAQAQESYSFETSEGFAIGAIDEQNNWGASLAEMVVAADATATNGANVLVVGTTGTGVPVTTPATPRPGVFSPTFTIAGDIEVSYDIKLSSLDGDNGASFFAAAQAPTAQKATSNVGFFSDGQVGVVATGNNGLGYFLAGTGEGEAFVPFQTVANQWYHVSIVHNFSATTPNIEVFIDGVSVFVGDVWGATKVEQLVVTTDNLPGSAKIDNIKVKVAGDTTGVNENLLSNLSVFPNPANDVVNVTNAENILVNGITVTDLNGRTVKSSKFDGVANASINISDLASGVYMMTVSSDKGSMTKKIVKN